MRKKNLKKVRLDGNYCESFTCQVEKIKLLDVNLRLFFSQQFDDFQKSIENALFRLLRLFHNFKVNSNSR